jgi:hypothetical protein
MDADATWQLRCGVVMPDHLHLLVVLGGRLPLSKAVSRLKAKASSSLHDHRPRIGSVDSTTISSEQTKTTLGFFCISFSILIAAGCVHAAIVGHGSIAVRRIGDGSRIISMPTVLLPNG